VFVVVIATVLLASAVDAVVHVVTLLVSLLVVFVVVDDVLVGVQDIGAESLVLTWIN